MLNLRFDGNIDFREIEQKGKRIRFTLKVKDSKGPGHRRAIGWDGKLGKRMPYACWHATGFFFENLFGVNPKAEVYSAGSLANPRIGKWITIKGGNWQDWEVYRGSMASELCDCQEDLQAAGDRLVRGRIVFRTLTNDQLKACPICSFDPGHYVTSDGSHCKCYDKNEQERLRKERQERRDKYIFHAREVI